MIAADLAGEFGWSLPQILRLTLWQLDELSTGRVALDKLREDARKRAGL